MGLFDIFKKKTEYERKLCLRTDTELMQTCFQNTKNPHVAALTLIVQKIIVTAKLLFDTLNRKYKLQESQQIRIMCALSSFLCSIAFSRLSYLRSNPNTFAVVRFISFYISPAEEEDTNTRACVKSRLDTYQKALSERRSTFEIVASDLSLAITNAENPMLDLETTLLTAEMLSFILSSEEVLLSMNSSLDEITARFEDELLRNDEWNF